MSLQQVTVGQLCADDIGRRVVVISEGNTFDGVLLNIYARRMFILSSWKEPYVNIEVTRPEDDKVKLELGNLPLDYVIEKAESKAIAYTGYEKQADSAVFQVAVAKASIVLDAAELVAAALADEIYDAAERGYYAPYAERIEMRAKAGWVVESITTMIHDLMTAHGSAGFAETAVLQRIWRDQATASRHGHTLGASGYEAFGKSLLGREDDARFVLPVV